MSLEHDPARQQRRGARRSVARVCFSPDELAEATGLSRQTLYRMMKDGRLRYVQFGCTRRIPATELTRLGLT